MPENKPATPAQERTQKTWVNVSVTEYPGSDGKPKEAPKPGEVITGAKDGWPPKWVVDQGLVVEQGSDEAARLEGSK